jgi:hypothetical protein
MIKLKATSILILSAGLLGLGSFACAHHSDQDTAQKAAAEKQADKSMVKKIEHTEKVPDEAVTKTQALAKEYGDSVVSTLKFKKGEQKLNEAARFELEKAVRAAKSTGEIDSITVIAWADSEYPGKRNKLSATQVNLAKERGDEIKKYLKDSLEVKNIEVHNMAKAPDFFSHYLKTADSRMKEKLVSEGVAPTTSEEPVLHGRASTAMVLVKTK